MESVCNRKKRKRKSNNVKHFDKLSGIRTEKSEDFEDELVHSRKETDISPKKIKTSYESQFEEKESSSNSAIIHEHVYFEKILQTLKEGVPDESKDLFVVNALEESKGKEVELSCHSLTSHCLELLLSYCKEPSVWKQLMTAFSLDKVTVCTSPNASHIVELLIQYSVKKTKDWLAVAESQDFEDDNEETFFLSWLIELGDFISENFTSCLEDQYAAHIACSLIRALGGDLTDSSKFMSKNAIKHKKQFSSRYDDKNLAIDLSPTSVYLENIPKIFKKKLKQLSKAVRKIENISEYVTESYCATVFEALIFVLEKRMPKQCGKLITYLSSELFSAKNKNGVALAFLQKNCSFIVEKMFQAANEDLQFSLWNDYIGSTIEYLIIHPIGNYVLQRAFDVVKDQSLLEVMCCNTVSSFDKILEAGHFGIFISMSAACNRLKAHQAVFMKGVLHCLHCAEPQDRQLKLIPLLLSFKKYEQADFLKTSKLLISLQGSLLVQNMLAFQKPIKLVNSLLDMKPEELSFLACHVQGCHVLTAFFKSDTVGEKNKNMCIDHMQHTIASIACDRNGSLTLARMWEHLTLKQRSVLANALVQNEEELKANKNGNIIFNKFRLFQYKRNYEQWKEIKSTCK